MLSQAHKPEHAYLTQAHKSDRRWPETARSIIRQMTSSENGMEWNSTQWKGMEWNGMENFKTVHVHLIRCIGAVGLNWH